MNWIPMLILGAIAFAYFILWPLYRVFYDRFGTGDPHD